MPKYINGINVSSLALGEGSGNSLTTGDRNTLLGASAGSGLTTAGYNTFVGSYTGSTEPDCQDAVVLSNGRGTVVCRWDGTGTCEQTVKDASAVAAPTINGRVRTGVDPATGALIYRTRLPSGQVTTSYSANKSVVDALGIDAATLGGTAAADYQLRSNTHLQSSGTGTTLVRDANALRLRDLEAGSGLTLVSTDPDRITLVGPTFQNETDSVPSNAHSLIGSTSGGANLRTKQLVAGSGIVLASTGSTVTIQSTASSSGGGDGVSLVSTTPSTGNGVSLVSQGTGPNLSIRALVAGDGVGLTQPSDGSAVVVGSTLRLESETGGSSLVSTGTGSVLKIKALSAGTGISLTSNGSTGLTIANTQPSSTLSSAGGTESLVQTGTGTSLAIKGLTAGYGTSIISGPSDVTIHNQRPSEISLRPSDVIGSTGQIRVIPQGYAIQPLNWPVNAELSTFSLPAIRYASSATANHTGEILFAVHGLPRKAQDLGFHLDLMVFAPNGTPGFTWNCTVTIPAPHPTNPLVWNYYTYTGSVTFDAFSSVATESSPFQVKELILATSSGGAAATIACMDGTTLPHFSRLNQQGFQSSPDIMHIRIAGSSPLTTAVDIPGIRLSLIPSNSAT